MYLENVPGANWFENDICENELGTTSDLCICFDLLIHIAEVDKYLNAVSNLGKSGEVLLVSGFDDKPVSFGPMTYFHESLSTTLKNVGLSAIPIGAYRGLTLFLAFNPSDLSSANRNIDKETLSLAVNFIDNPIKLITSIFKSIQTIGFFPNHLPRCIEYPWILNCVEDTKPLKILDAGAGVSVLPILLAEMGHSVITVDNSNIIRTKTDRSNWNEWGFLDYSEIHKNIKSLNMPYEETGFTDELDVVISVSVIEHLPSNTRKCWIKKACAQLVSGGKLILTVDTYPFSDNLWNFSEGVEVEDLAGHGTVNDLVEEINASGMIVCRLEKSNWLPRSRVGMVRIEAYKE
jgi:2-polyprenyl-3-methyl-5-hydroxy-6-metoxy-1,4-benzoquinol methylase